MEELIIINQDNIKDLIYEIRGQKVMLDFDLARIYGYETRTFNQQVKNNIYKFPEDFMFQITKEETELLMMSKKLMSFKTEKTSGSKGGRTHLPHAFTEQGIYMLMTVLKGELAAKQSLTLIRLFKSMKDYIVESNNLVTMNEVLRLSRQVDQNTRKISTIENKLDIIMDNFTDPSTYKHFLIFDGQRIEADIAYKQIYSCAKESIILVDDYIDLRTLRLLKSSSKEISITIISDNIAKDKLTNGDFNDFLIDTGINVTIKPTNNKVHDRYIVIDYKTGNEAIYHSGGSSKDAGNKIITITRIEKPGIYHPFLDDLLNPNY